jgi:hypothetical protein
METTALLAARGTTHGRFEDNARHAQALRAQWRTSVHWKWMPPEHREALDHIAGKLSRILSGQSTFKDHWDDVAGYATLASEACASKSYDDNQLQPLMTCRSCGKSFYMRRDVCDACSGAEVEPFPLEAATQVSYDLL